VTLPPPLPPRGYFGRKIFVFSGSQGVAFWKILKEGGYAQIPRINKLGIYSLLVLDLYIPYSELGVIEFPLYVIDGKNFW
jgi:hypothetical protein